MAKCPVCAKGLYAFHYPHTQVTVEACKECEGLWLNTGEVKAIHKARQDLPKGVESDERANADGVKGALIRFIDSAIEHLNY
jgi:Zn-finger nucleic acid-binding protein